jgi:cytochrome c556
MSGSSFRKLCSFVVGAAAIACAVQAATPAETLKVRHEHYEELGDAFKAIRDQANAGSPDFEALQKSADTVHKASVNQIQWFPKGTGPEAGKTRALPEIWTKTEDFTAAMKMFEERAPALVTAAKSRDVDAVKKAFKELGGACKNCHEQFRAPE